MNYKDLFIIAMILLNVAVWSLVYILKNYTLIPWP